MRFVCSFGVGCYQFTNHTQLYVTLSKQPPASVLVLAQRLNVAEEELTEVEPKYKVMLAGRNTALNRTLAFHIC